MENKVKLEVVGLTAGNSNNASYTLILGESDSQIKLPIVIGAYEAQTIAFELEGIKPSRPMTHDLFKSFAEAFKIILDEVYISNLDDGVFYSQLIFSMSGSLLNIDARTSDAISLALRFKCPIYIKKSILDQAGIVIEDQNTDAPARPNQDLPPKSAKPVKDNFNNFSLKELNEMLDDAIKEEEYDKAALIRDEITKRNMS